MNETPDQKNPNCPNCGDLTQHAHYGRWLMGLPAVWDSSGGTAMLSVRRLRSSSSKRT